jgi:hypothetical protein
MELIPYRVSHFLLAIRPAGRIDSSGIPCPFNDLPWTSPVWSRCVTSDSGSALRLSQPLSGFLAGPGFAAFFRAATVPGISPFRVFPSQKIACLSRDSLAPLQLSTSVQSRTTVGLVAPRFADFHAFAQSPGSPEVP